MIEIGIFYLLAMTVTWIIFQLGKRWIEFNNKEILEISILWPLVWVTALLVIILSLGPYGND